MPAISPGRCLRVVTEMERSTIGSISSSMRDNVVLPAPEGEDSTNISPRRAIVACSRPAALAIGRGRGRPPPAFPRLRGRERESASLEETSLIRMPALFQILHLLAELLHDAFQLQTDIGQLD